MIHKNMKALVIIISLNSGGVVLFTYKKTIISFCMFIFPLMAIQIVFLG